MRSAILILLALCSFAQGGDYSPDKENVIFKTQTGKQLYQEDVQCGAYFWKTQKAARNGQPALYFFYGDPAYGKNKLGLYEQSLYRVVVNAKKDPPTVQVIRDPQGNLKEVRVQMTEAEWAASKACLPNRSDN